VGQVVEFECESEALAVDAASYIRSFHPGVFVEQDCQRITLSSEKTTGADLRSIWATARYSQRTAPAAQVDRAQLLEALFQ
jgi:hypothetical protein